MTFQLQSSIFICIVFVSFFIILIFFVAVYQKYHCCSCHHGMFQFQYFWWQSCGCGEWLITTGRPDSLWYVGADGIMFEATDSKWGAWPSMSREITYSINEARDHPNWHYSWLFGGVVVVQTVLVVTTLSSSLLLDKVPIVISLCRTCLPIPQRHSLFSTRLSLRGQWIMSYRSLILAT